MEGISKDQLLDALQMKIKVLENRLAVANEQISILAVIVSSQADEAAAQYRGQEDDE